MPAATDAVYLVEEIPSSDMPMAAVFAEVALVLSFVAMTVHLIKAVPDRAPLGASRTIVTTPVKTKAPTLDDGLAGIAEIFRKFDHNGNGKIDGDELEVALRVAAPNSPVRCDFRHEAVSLRRLCHQYFCASARWALLDRH